jgi:hypothetical protein
MDVGADHIAVRIDRFVEHDHFVAREEVLPGDDARSPDDDRTAGSDLDRIEPTDPVE